MATLIKISHFIFLGFVVFSLLYFLYRFPKFNDKRKFLVKSYIIVIAGLSFFLSFLIIRNDILNPHEWDFLCFYMYGKVAVKGLDFYINANYLSVLKSVNLPFTPFHDFGSTLNFQYFPPNIFYFVPLGFFDFNTANYIWLIINLTFLTVDVYLVYKMFFKNKNLFFFLGLLSLFLILPGTRSALNYEHNTFIFLFFLLLAWKDRDLPVSGVWLSIGMFTKPILALFFIYPILRRNWKAILTAIATAVIICLVTLLILGPSVFVTFFTNNPSLKVQNMDYIEWTNQSLLATILRITNYNFSYSTPLIHPLFIISALILCAVSFWIILKIENSMDGWAFAILTLLALMIYPGSISSYGPLLMPVLIFLFADGELLPSKIMFYSILIAVIFAIMFLSSFVSYLILWTTLVIIIFNEKRFKMKIDLSKKIRPDFQ